MEERKENGEDWAAFWKRVLVKNRGQIETLLISKMHEEKDRENRLSSGAPLDECRKRRKRKATRLT